MSRRRTAVGLVLSSALAAGGWILLRAPGGGAPWRELVPFAPTGAPTPTAIPIAESVNARPVRAATVPLPTGVTAPAVRRVAVPGAVRQLTRDGCCPGAWWSPDSTALRYVDRPDGSAGTGIYAVAVWPPGGLPQVVDTDLAGRAGSVRLAVSAESAYSMVEDLATGDRWPLPTGGNPAIVSPDGSRVVWWETQDGWAHDATLVKAFGSDIYGFDLRELGSLWGMDVVSFLPDNRRVLVTGRPVRTRAVYIAATLDLVSGQMTQIARGSWLSDALLSPGGTWVVYLVTFDTQDPDANGVWVVPTAGGEPRKLAFVGAYRWRDDGRLVFIPMLPGAPYHAVWQLDLAGGAQTLLVDPATIPIRVAGNDWSISPDGQTLAFVSEDDRNLWAIDLPP
jgi:hypothetical protein